MQPTIKEQLDLEAAMMQRGSERYEKSVAAAQRQGRGADTKHSRRLMQAHVEVMTDAIREECESKRPGVRSKYLTLLSRIEPDKAAYILLRGIFNALTAEPTVHAVVTNVGRMIEDEIRFARFKKSNKEYYDEIIKDFKRKGTKNYRHMHRVLTFKANEMQDKWKPWSVEERAGVGLKLLDILLKNTELVEIGTKAVKKKARAPQKIIRATKETVDWITKFTEFASVLDPDRTPTIIQPDPWTAFDQGGYYSPQLRSITPFVLGASKRHASLLRSSDLSSVFDAVNALQAVGWSVNRSVLSVVQEAWSRNLRIGMPPSEPYAIPPAPIKEGQKSASLRGKAKEAFEDWKREAAILYSMEGERVSKCFQISRALRMASEYSDYKTIWFVYQCDFRGRIYAASNGLSPQGTDVSKALLQFAEGKPLGADGLFWLRVHGANVYGFDKASYDARSSWVLEREASIQAVADDPLANAEQWRDADKPWQYLAFCFEYARASRCADPRRFVSHIPIALDGSCNGLQHFSAMLRDPIGGAATNLRRANVPADIYSEVAGLCTKYLVASSDPMAHEWLAFCSAIGSNTLPRGLAKKPVMTLPYGSTKRTCTDSIFQFIRENKKGFFKCGDFKAALWLTEHLWKSISDVVVAARAAMDFVQKTATALAKQNAPLQWTTTDGFVVHQARYQMQSVQVRTSLGEGITYKMRVDKPTRVLDAKKQAQGSAPNFVHSQDGTHLRLTVRTAVSAGVSSFAMIHDDFGTHACDVGKLHRAIRDTFVALYDGVDTLGNWRAGLGDSAVVDRLPKPPEFGDLDVTEVREAAFFFG